MKTTAEIVKSLIAEQIGVDVEGVTDEKRRVADLGFDSLDDIEVLMALEDEFGIAIADEEAEPCETVAQIVALVEGKVRP